MISVVMSCYNSERFVAKAIESILNQSYKDFEFIIWNDGSTDRTEEIIKGFRDSRIRYYYHENTGLGQALRLACEKAHGEYIARMDADDISLPKRLEIEVHYLEKNPNVAVVSSAFNYINIEDQYLGRSFPLISSTAIKKRLSQNISVIAHPSSMFRRDIYEKAGGYHALRKSQDLLLFSRMSNYGDFANIPEPLLNYRISMDSISSQTDGNVYYPLIRAYLCKMIHDQDVLERDVELYNNIVALSRKVNTNHMKDVNNRYKKNLDMQVYEVFSLIFGKEKTGNAISIFKTILESIK